jgi:adenosylcobinamide-phosphate synthase
MSGAVIVLLALLLDAVMGEPDALWRRFPHPAVLMGRAVGALERRLNRGPARRERGIAAMAVLGAGAWLVGLFLAGLPMGWAVEIAAGAILLAQRSLVDHVRDVATALRRSVPGGRTAVARIVGRDTRDMDGPAISRAAIESAAENFSDGVVAPAFWFLLCGLPGLMLYKVTNTADSMVGYRTPELERFGWAAARFDDLLNWLPARLSALILCAAFGRWPGWAMLARDARLHRSPNAGWPEAAMAQGLDVALAGPRSYGGAMQDFPWVWPTGNRSPGAADIDAATDALWRAWAVLLGGVALVVAV